MTTTFTPGKGRLALDRYDFQDHVDGYNFTHNADAITVSPGIVFDSSTQTNVYDALTGINSELADLALSGKGFILVGDGYDTYANSLSTPDTPYDSNVPAFDTYLNDVLNNSNNPLYFRIRSGGVVVIKAGTYKFTGTVNIPPGIMLMGENYGTKIVNQTNGTTLLFRIKVDSTRIPDDGVDSTEKFIFSKESALINITIADNFVEPKFLGDLSYKDPINNDSLTPLVGMEEGSSLYCENVKFLGKTTYSLGVISDITSIAVGNDPASLASTAGTRLKISNCSIDGFAIPVSLFTSSGKNDHFIMTNSLVRGYGFLNSDFVSAANNSILKLGNLNININNNYLFGYDDTVTSAFYITNLLGAPPTRQSKCRIIITNNNVAIKKSSASANTTFELVKFAGGTVSSYFTAIIKNNNFDNSGVISQITNIVSSPYTIDSSTFDQTLLVNVAGATTINLPTHSSGRELVIKDISGAASSNNITLVRSGGTGNIEGVASDYIIDSDFQVIKLVSDGTSWWFTR